MPSRGPYGTASRSFALSCLFALAGCASRGTASLPASASDADPLSTTPPGLSRAGSPECRYGAHRHLIVARFEHQAALELGVRGQVPSEVDSGLGNVIARQFACTRYVIEVALPLVEYGSGGRTDAAFRGDVSLIEAGIYAAGDRVTLWSIADSLRLDSSEPFVYGSAMELSEDTSVSLRFEPNGSGARLMLVYRIGL